MLNLQGFLKKLNWTQYESKAYCAIVENGPMKANDLAINREKFKAPKPVMTGIEIKQLGGGPLEHLLVLVFQ